eukprot:4537722-Amphidinium_carterae.1
MDLLIVAHTTIMCSFRLPPCLSRNSVMRRNLKGRWDNEISRLVLRLLKDCVIQDEHNVASFGDLFPGAQQSV